MSLIFKISGALVFLCPFATKCPQFYHFIVFIYFFIALIMIFRENPEKYPSVPRRLFIPALQKLAVAQGPKIHQKNRN
jgi:hypothetical protein